MNNETTNPSTPVTSPSFSQPKPKLSVILAAYNGAPYLAEQLDSIAAQTWPVDEILIRDDKSTDNSAEVIDQWIADHPEVPVKRIEAKENLGYIGNFAALIKEATGDWIFLSDQDDRWHEDKVATMMQAANEVPDALLIASSFEFMHGNGEVYHLPLNPGWSNQNLIPWEVENAGGLNPVAKDQMLLHNYFQGCAMMIRKELGEDYLCRDDFNLPHDWFLALLASVHGHLYYLDKPLFDYRIHDSNVTGLPQAKKETKLLKFRRHFNRYYRTAVIADMEKVYSTIQRAIPELNCQEIQDRLDFCRAYLKEIDGKNVKSYRKIKEMPGFALCMNEDEFHLGELYVKLSRVMKMPDKRI